MERPFVLGWRTKLDENGDNLTTKREQPAGPAQNVADIQYSLKRILEYPSFRSSQQLSAFLSYVVNEEIAGRGALIKAYSVAVDALGRPESFDPSHDPVIRVIATRLRKALDAFYAEAGAKVPIRIKLVRGSYRPVFLPIAPKRLPSEEAPEARSAARLLQQRQLRRYRIIISVLLILLTLLFTYLIWHVDYHMRVHPTETLIPFDMLPGPE